MLVNLHERGHLKFEPARQLVLTGFYARLEVPQTIADQPGLVADVLLQVVFQTLEALVPE